MLKYNVNYLHLLPASLSATVIAIVALILLGFERFAAFPIVGIYLIMHLLQRCSGVAFDKKWTASIHKSYNKTKFQDAMHLQMVIIGFGSLLALYLYRVFDDARP